MDKATAARIGIDVLKFVGNVVVDTIDVRDYRITVMIERKIDEKQGIVVDNFTADKKMNHIQVETISKKFKELINSIK